MTFGSIAGYGKLAWFAACGETFQEAGLLAALLHPPPRASLGARLPPMSSHAISDAVRESQ